MFGNTTTLEGLHVAGKYRTKHDALMLQACGLGSSHFRLASARRPPGALTVKIWRPGAPARPEVVGGHFRESRLELPGAKVDEEGIPAQAPEIKPGPFK